MVFEMGLAADGRQLGLLRLLYKKHAHTRRVMHTEGSGSGRDIMRIARENKKKKNAIEREKDDSVAGKMRSETKHSITPLQHKCIGKANQEGEGAA